MLRIVALLALMTAACGVAPRPESPRTAAAFEVPLPTDSDKAAFLRLLRAVAKADGYHVDAATQDELRQLSDVSTITFNAVVWRGSDEEIIASAMDFKDHIGRVWLSFAEGENSRRCAEFRRALIPRIQQRWPLTVSLPIMPSGAIPLAADLVLTSSGYAVKPTAQAKYQASPK